MLAAFSGSVMSSAGRTVAVQPLMQMVRWIVAWVTCGFSAPGVHAGSGREYKPEPIWWQEPGAGWGCTTSFATAETRRTTEPPGDRPCRDADCRELGACDFAWCGRWRRVGEV